METETPGSSASLKRPRPLILMLFGLVLAVFLIMKLGGSAGPGQPASNLPRPAQQTAGGDETIDPAALDVKLEALAGERPGPGDTERNPFRFKPKPAPPPPPVKPSAPPAGSVPTGPPGPPPAPAVPPITVEFIGTLDLPDGVTVAIFTDCTVGRRSRAVREGETILGQYRLVKIGLQSVVVEHLDGRGRTTLAKTGQDCVK
jgi:hypothetical protein